MCNACKHVWCGACGVPWHHNMTCAEHQRQAGAQAAEEGLTEYRKGTRVIVCPTCGHGIEKASGCNRVQCALQPASRLPAVLSGPRCGVHRRGR